MSKICRNCNSLLLDTASFCNNCGARVADTVFDDNTMKKCEHCGAVLNKNARFCTNCGLPVGVPEAQGYAGRCERCGTWLKPNAQFCTNCGRRTAMQSYNFTQQPAAPVQAAAVVPAVTQPPTNDGVYAPIAEEAPQPKVLPPLTKRPTRRNDYEDNMSIDMSFDLPPVDAIVTPEPDNAAEDVPAPQEADSPAEEIVDVAPEELSPVQSEEAPADETEVLSGEVL